MANPNRAMAHVANNPWQPHRSFRSESEAERCRDDLRAEGVEARMSSGMMGPRKKPWRVWRVWVR